MDPMKPRTHLAAIWALAALLLAVGLVSTTLHALRWPDRRARLEQIAQDQNTILAEAQRLGDPRAMIEGLIIETPPEPFVPWLERVLVPVAGTFSEREAVAMPQGWRARRCHVAWSQGELTLVSTILQRAGEQRPPWRLVDIQIEALRTAEGSGRVDLLLEQVERASP